MVDKRERHERSGARGESAQGEAQGRTERPPADVHLGADFVLRWAKELDPTELRLYVALAREAPTHLYHDAHALRVAIGEPSDADLERRLAQLEKRRLVEVVRRRGRLHFHFLARAKDGVHHAEPVRPSIKEALEFHASMTDELLQVASADETDDLRERAFERYPELRDEYLLSRTNREAGSPAWTLWLELSLFLMNRFEERYGDLKTEHADVFKDVSAHLLRLRLEVVDRLTARILDGRDEIFRTRGAGWVAGLAESAFVSLPLVRELSRKYRVGAEQIYLNTIEALQGEGLCVVELDARGRATDLVLPTTTGLSDEEARLTFLHVEEMTRQEIERFEETLQRIQRARESYGRYLLERAARVVQDLHAKDRVEDVNALLDVVAERVNEALDLVREEGEDGRVTPRRVRREDARAALEAAPARAR